jgi:hypothetical protein
MNTIADLTKTQFTKLLDEYFAPPEKRSKMTEMEIKELAIRLNEKINVPLINDTFEEKILIKVILNVDGFLYDHLPNEIYDLIHNTGNGIDDIEATRLITRLTVLANSKIDIPYIPESAEHVAIKYVIGVIINAARKHWDFNKAKDATEDHLLQ